MPIYVYECKNCKHNFDTHQSITEDALSDCVECGEPALKRIPQRIGIAFVGPDFYVNQNPPKN